MHEFENPQDEIKYRQTINQKNILQISKLSPNLDLWYAADNLLTNFIIESNLALSSNSAEFNFDPAGFDLAQKCIVLALAYYPNATDSTLERELLQSVANGLLTMSRMMQLNPEQESSFLSKQTDNIMDSVRAITLESRNLTICNVLKKKDEILTAHQNIKEIRQYIHRFFQHLEQHCTIFIKNETLNYNEAIHNIEFLLKDCMFYNEAELYLDTYVEICESFHIVKMYFDFPVLDFCESHISPYLSYIHSAEDYSSKNVFSCRHYIPKDSVARGYTTEYLKNSITSSSDPNTAADSFEKLLILNPKEVTGKEISVLSQNCQSRSKHSNFFGDLGSHIHAIEKKQILAPEGKTPLSRRLKNLLLALLCAFIGLFIALIGAEKLSIAAVIMENANYVVSLGVTILCLIIGYKIFDIIGLLLGFGAAQLIKGFITAKLLLGLIAVILGIAALVLLYHALSSDRKKIQERRTYLNKVKKDIQVSMDHIHLIMGQLDQVDADVDVSTIRTYYEDAEKYLIHLKSYK